VVTLDHTGASSPVIGIQGSGTITFDQKVGMNFIATPLADWAKDAKGTGFLSDAGAAIIGKAQDVVNKLQGQLYQFRVTGDISKPKVEPVVAPLPERQNEPALSEDGRQSATGNRGGGVEEWKRAGSNAVASASRR